MLAIIRFEFVVLCLHRGRLGFCDRGTAGDRDSGTRWRQLLIRGALDSGEEFRAVTIHDRKKFIVFDVTQAASDLDVPQESEEIEDLSKSGVL